MKPTLALRRVDFESPDQYASALKCLSAGDLDAGLRLLTETCERYPDDPRGDNFLGMFYYNAGRIEKACVHFSRAAALAKGVSVYAYNEGSALLMAKRPREAASAFWRSLHGDALLREAHYWAWGAFNLSGITRDVNARLREALHRDPAQVHFEPLSERVVLGAVTLCAVDCAVPDLAARSLRRSMAQCRFGAIKLFTSHPCSYDGIETVLIDRISGIGDYSRFVMKSLGKYIDTQFALVTQWDGYVINATAWSDAFLDYDYVGARWEGEQIKAMGYPPHHNVGNGGFSLRSDIYLGAGSDPELVLTHPEDAHLCGTYRPYLEEGYGIRYADAAVADRFSFEIIVPDTKPFGFHGCFNLCCFEQDPKWMRFDFLGPNAFVT